MTEALRRGRGRLAEVVGVPVGALLVAVLTTWPLAIRLSEEAHDRYDTAFHAWIIDWVQHALGSSAPLFDANIFLGNPRTLAYSDSFVGTSVLLLPARWLDLTPIGVHNAGLLLAYAASASAGYVFAKVVTGRVVVALCTAVAFGFGPSNTYLAQHLNILLHPGPALAAAAVWVLAERRAGSRSPVPAVIALVASLALQGSGSFNTLAITVVAVLAVALARWRDLGLGGLLLVVGATAAAFALLLPLLWPYIQNRSDGSGPLRFELVEYGVTGANFFQVDPSLAFWGEILGSPTGLFGQQPSFPGVVLLGLAVYGLLLWRRAADRRVHRVACTLVVVGLVLSVGTGDRGWLRFTPYRLIYEFVPGGTALRATGRFWVVGLLGMGLLAGLAVEHLAGAVARRLAPRRRSAAIAGVVALALLGVLLEGHRWWLDTPELDVAAADRVLADLPEPGGVVYLPLPTDADLFSLLPQAQRVYQTTAHHRPTPNGYASHYPDSFLDLADHLADLPRGDTLDRLRRMGVRFVLVDAQAGAWAPLLDPAAAEPLRLVGAYEGDVLYEVPDFPQGPGTR